MSLGRKKIVQGKKVDLIKKNNDSLKSIKKNSPLWYGEVSILLKSNLGKKAPDKSDDTTTTKPEGGSGHRSNGVQDGASTVEDVSTSARVITTGSAELSTVQGSPFTWRRGDLFQRLDRFLINIQWRLMFQNAVVRHLPFFKSDHHAILVQMNSVRRVNKSRRSFRFLASWLTHDDFPNIMHNSWTRGSLCCSQVPVLHASLRR